MRRWIVAASTVLALAGGAAAAPSALASGSSGGGLSVDGAVTTPTTYSREALAALPQTALTDAGGHRLTGVLVEDLVQRSAPTPVVGKNPVLAVRVTTTGQRGSSVTAALGELDPAFGNHPALVALTVDGRPDRTPDVVFPGDRSPFRTVVDARSLTVAVATAPADLAVPPGAVRVVTGSRTVTLSARVLAALPARTVTASFTASGVPVQYTESGPPLLAVLLAAGVVPDRTTAVTAVGSDGYVATVTPGEALFGGRPLLLSRTENGAALAQPRLVADGDVKGGRYVTGVVVLSVTRG